MPPQALEPLEEVLGHYPLAVLDIRNESYKEKKGVWWVRTESGMKILKKVSNSEQTLRFTLDAVRHLRKNGVLLPEVNRTSDGNEYVNIEGTCFVLTDAVEGRNPSYSVPEEMALLASGLAAFHRASVGFKPSEGTKPNSGEVFCRTYSHLYGLPVVILRFFTVYGPRQRPDMAIHTFTKAITEGEEIKIFGDGASIRDYTYIDDIIDGIMSSMELPCSFEIINLGNSAAVSILDLIGILENKLGKKARISFHPIQPGDVPATCADITKARSLLGCEPRVPLEEGIERFVEWYKKMVPG